VFSTTTSRLKPVTAMGVMFVVAMAGTRAARKTMLAAKKRRQTSAAQQGVVLIVADCSDLCGAATELTETSGLCSRLQRPCDCDFLRAAPMASAPCRASAGRG